jgi:hypothetical protein
VTENKKDELDPDISQFISTSNGGNSESSGNVADDRNSGTTTATGKSGFKLIAKILENPKPYFADTDFYKKVLAGEGENAKKVHELLTQFLNTQDVQDKSIYRGRLIPTCWNLMAGIAVKINQNLPLPKIFLLRFGILSPTLLSPEIQDMLSKVVYKNTTGEPLHYADEWLHKVATGVINPSATDELKRAQKDTGQKLVEKVDQTKGQRDTELTVVRSKVGERSALEDQLFQAVELIRNHQLHDEYDGLADAYSADQKKTISGISDFLRKMISVDKEIERAYNTLRNLDQNIDSLSKKTEDIGPATQGVDSAVITAEFNTLRQMSKLCVGRKGNHFPVLMRSYFVPNIRDLGIRENVINEMIAVEQLDAELFLRTFKNTTTRIVPNIILLPNYGERGVCWEPFERRNRSTSRGRVAIPLYSKNLRLAVISAMADLRWQVAKEKAQHHWMEEGITGRYYQWFSDKKLRGDVKEYFINDYILWILKESEGMQKVDRAVRGIFWRMIPFPQDIKEKLKNRGFVYNELYKKDINISKSDGY